MMQKILPLILAGIISLPGQANPFTINYLPKSTSLIAMQDSVYSTIFGKVQLPVKRKVPILMYHEIGTSDEYPERYCVKPETLWNQLEWLHMKGFVSISLADYVNGNYRYIDSRKKPVVLTFDDATAGQFRYLEDKFGHLYVDPKCGIGVMHKFAKMYPDFGFNAAFFIDYARKDGHFQVPFGQPGHETRKIKDLIETGMVIGNHTLEHVDMGNSGHKLNSNQQLFLEYIVNLIEPKYNMQILAYPYGAIPKSLKQRYDYACAAWGGVAPDISDTGFDRYKIPRIEINDDFKNLEAYLK